MSPTLRCAIGWIGYLAAFVFLTFPLVGSVDGSVPAHFGPDLEHSLWVQWWVSTAIDSEEHALFHSQMIDFPQRVDLQLADVNLAVNGAFYAAGRGLGRAATWNLLLLASFALSAGLTWRLATRLGASAGAGWLAGLFFAASPCWMANALNGWCYLVHIWTLPLVLLAARAARAAPGLRSGAYLGASLSLAFHVTPYYFLYAVTLLAVLASLRLATLRAWLRRGDARVALGAAVVALAVLTGPRAVAMAVAASRELVVHHGPLNTALSLPLVELLWPSSSAVSARLPRLGYMVGFVGWTLVAAIALSVGWAGRSADARVSRWRIVADARVQRWLIVADARVQRWLIGAGAMLLLALGPSVVLSEGAPTSIPLPATLLQRLPIFDLTTNHWRWVVPGSLCLALALAHALGPLERRLAALRPAAAWALAPLLAVLWAAEVAWVWPLPYPRPLWQVQASPVAALLRDRDDVHAVLDRTDRRKLNQMVHGKPIALGWLPRIDTETQRANQAMVDTCAVQGRSCLRAHGIDAVIRDDRTALLLDDDGAVREVLHSGP